MVAYCYADGAIRFGKRSAKGALPIAASANEHHLREAVQGVARKGYQDGVWLVPGIPEAPDQGAALEALIVFRGRVEESLRTQEGAE